MASAASKIGASSPLELVRLAAMVTRDPRTTATGTTTLTAAERDVLELLQHGLSNAQIAKIRSRSVRTIANQVASLLSKTNSHTRRALLASDDDRGQVQKPEISVVAHRAADLATKPGVLANARG